MKKILFLLTMVFTLPTFAMSGQYGISSDYVWRGVSQSAGNPSVWACLDQDVMSGVYVGGCASSVDFDDDNKIELDLYGGYYMSKGKFSLDVGFISYRYDNNKSANFEERYVELGYGPVTIGKAHGLDEALDYEYVDLDIPFLKFADVSLHYGDYGGIKDKSINVEYPLSDSMKIGLLVQSNVRDDDIDLGDAVSIHFTGKF